MHTIVNPELPDTIDSDDPPTTASRRGTTDFKAAVEKLFGTSHKLVVNAVDDFLRARPGDLDHHMLRVIAASAPSFSDPNHVALMIRSLRPTQMNVGLAPIDLPTGRRQFQLALAGYRPETARRLVLDLVNQSTHDVLRNSPYVHVSEAGREIVRDQLRANLEARGELPWDNWTRPFVTSQMITTLLDRIEAQIEAVERGSNGHPPGRMTLSDISTSFYHVFGRDNFHVLRTGTGRIVTDEQITRAWQLIERCVPGPVACGPFFIGLTYDKQLLALHGRSFLAAVERYVDPRSEIQARRIRARMLASPELPEEVARDTVRAGVRFDNHTLIDRLAFARSLHYRRTSELLTTPDPEEIDKAIIGATSSLLQRKDISGLETETGLHLAARKANGFSQDSLRGLLDNPRLTPSHVTTILQNLHPDQFIWTRGRRDERVAVLLTHPKMTDEHLAYILDRIRPSDWQHAELALETAASNPSSGPRVLRQVDDYCDNFLNSPTARDLLLRVAVNSASTYVHETLVARAVDAGDEDLARELMRNGTTRPDVFGTLAERFPQSIPLDVRTSSEQFPFDATLPSNIFSGYASEDVAALVLEGAVSASRADALPPEGLHSTTRARLIDENLVSDECLLRWTANVDSHIALEMATHPRALTTASGLETIAARSVRDTAEAVSSGVALPDDKSLRTWNQLPNGDDLPLPTTPLHELVARQVVNGHRLRVPTTGRQLIELSERMHNCLAGYRYSVADGDTMIVYTETEDDIYAAAIDVLNRPEPVPEDSRRATSDIDSDVNTPSGSTTGHVPNARPSPTLKVGEINSKFNTRSVPDSFRSGIHDLVRTINNGTLRIRPPRRRPLPAELAQVTEHESIGSTERARGDAPSLLGDAAAVGAATTIDPAIAPVIHEQTTVADTPSNDGTDLGHTLA